MMYKIWLQSNLHINLRIFTYSSTNFDILVKVHCNTGVLSPTCQLCPQNDDTVLNSWCSGNCYFDDKEEECKEGSELDSNFLFEYFLILFDNPLYMVYPIIFRYV